MPPLTFEQLKQKLQEKKESKGDGPRWKRVGDLEKERERRYLEEEAKAAEEREAKRQRRLLERMKSPSPSPSPEQVAAANAARATSPQQDSLPTEEGNVPLAKEEVVRRLRAAGHPITLFGETDETRYQRLQKIEARQLERHGQDDMRTTQGKNQLQEFHIEDEPRELTEEETKKREAQELLQKQEEFRQLKLKLADKEHLSREEHVVLFLEHIFKAWEIDLQSKPFVDRHSALGQRDMAFFKQTASFVEPLMEALRQKVRLGGILEPLMLIVESLQQREYVRANETYITLSIGKAAWPMGVTSVGIHERSSRDRIEWGKTAHILNNETQRKYIQGLKRLMTQCQKLYPTDPSKMVWL
eukprot:TRINITY_DN4062_c0_g1_i1.p1 TRINITY_DN4062_c0_g1~~TRINITY_DN4062_c0_g1_i1.p1  ORF type:complete len:358 (+),score=85.91 TRINITY_DN4062_c0_g1_i1:44-1117(+)